MDGLMLDSEQIYEHAWQTAAADLGYKIDDALYKVFTGRNTSDSEATLLQIFGADFPVAEFRRRWSTLWKTRVETLGIPTKPGLDELLAFVEQARLPTAIATSTDRDRALLSLRAAGLEGRITRIVTRDQVKNGKPAPDIYVEAARQTNIAPRHCLAIEDSEAGALAAQAAGTVVLLVPDRREPSAEARAAAFRVLPSLHEVLELLASWNG